MQTLVQPFVSFVIFAEKLNAMDKIIGRESELGLLDRYHCCPVKVPDDYYKV